MKKHNFWLALMLVGTFLIGFVLVACNDYKTTEPKDPIAETYHQTSINVYKHGEGFRDPENNCTECHGADLKGDETKGGNSCFECHGNFWDFYTYPHPVKLDGSPHGEGYKNPFEEGCDDCHGPDLETTTDHIAPCYECHKNKWDYGDTTHDVKVKGTNHAKGYKNPVKNDCVDCHGYELTGEADMSTDGTTDATADGCYGCHFLYVDQNNDVSHDTILRLAYSRKNEALHPEAADATADSCVNCHGKDLRGKMGYARSCYLCHKEVWLMPENHDYLKHGIKHTSGMGNLEHDYYDPEVYDCHTCHGEDLEGTETVKGCYGTGCHPGDINTRGFDD